MKERRYKEDYGLETYFDDKGREKRRPVYRGKWYRLDKSDADFKKRALLPFIFCAATYLIYMKMNTPSGRCMYVLPLAACALIPLIYWAMGVVTLWRNPPAMTRLQKETGPCRVLRSAAGCGILLAMACIGDIIFVLASPIARQDGELKGLVTLAVSAACGLGGFIRAKEVFNRIFEIEPTGK